MKFNLQKILAAFVFDGRWFAAAIIVLSAVLSLQHYFYIPAPGSPSVIDRYTHYNDYLIFRQSFFHLIHRQNLYVPYPGEYFDLYKYTPLFALLMAPFAALPAWAGLILWNSLNALILFFGLRNFPFPAPQKTIFAIGFSLIEAITSLQNAESNCLMAGLALFAFAAMEKQKTGLSVFLLMIAVFVKPFALAFFALYLFYPTLKKTVLYSMLCFTLLFCLPLVVVSPSELAMIYRQWLFLMFHGKVGLYSFSVMGVLKNWFGIDRNNLVLVAGMILFPLPLLRYKCFAIKKFKSLFFSYILVWVVIFNPLAESPTYIIAISGVAIWFAFSPTRVNRALLILCFLLSELAPTDIYPAFIRRQYFLPYLVKALPVILIWAKMLFEMVSFSTRAVPLAKDAEGG